jgi:hypothetical protein
MFQKELNKPYPQGQGHNGTIFVLILFIIYKPPFIWKVIF